MRMLIGLTGLAALSALATAVADATGRHAQTTTTVVQAQIEPSVPVTHVHALRPAQTGPDRSAERAPSRPPPPPTPRIVVVTTTRQSGKP